MRRILFCIGLLFCLPFLSRSDWLVNDIRVNATDGNAFLWTPDDPIAMDICSDGNSVFAAWLGRIDNQKDIYFNFSNDAGMTWQPEDRRLSSETPEVNFIAMDLAASSGRVYAVWDEYEDPSNRSIQLNVSQDGGLTWLPAPILLDNGVWPRICASGAKVYIAYSVYDPVTGSGDILCKYSHDYGVTWQTSASTLAATGGVPLVSCSQDRVYAVWQSKDLDETGENDIFFNTSSDAGVTWLDSPIRLDTGDAPFATSSTNPQIACQGERVDVVWKDNRLGFSNIYFNTSADGGASWLPAARRLSTGTVRTYSPQLCSHGDHIYVTWFDLRNSAWCDQYWDVYFNTSADGGATWQPADTQMNVSYILRVESGMRSPRITCLEDRVFVVWDNPSDHRGLSSSIFCRFSPDGGNSWPGGPLGIDHSGLEGEAFGLYPLICSSVNNVHVLWPDNRDTVDDYNIYSNTLTGVLGPPDEPSGPDPEDDAAEVSVHSDLAWNSIWNADSYDVYFGESPSPGQVGTTSDPSYSLPTLTPSDTYYWKIVAHNAFGQTAGPEWSFTAEAFPLSVTLTLAAGTGGTTDPAPGVYSYYAGEEVTVTAVPETGREFLSWSGDISSPDRLHSQVTLRLDSDRSIRARFVSAAPDVNHVGAFRPEAGRFFLNTDWDGASDINITYGDERDLPISGDWDGDGDTDIGVYRPDKSRFYLDFDGDGQTDLPRTFGRRGDLPVTGDWDGDGDSDLGVFRPETCRFILDADGDGAGDFTRILGRCGDLPVTGDWDGDGDSDIGVFRPETCRFFLDADGDGIPDFVWALGRRGDLPIIGDWDGDGDSDIGVFRPNICRFFLDFNGDGAANLAFNYGRPGDLPISGDWDG